MSNQFLGFEPLTLELQKTHSTAARAEARRDPQRAELVREILNRLEADQAAVIECPDAAELQTLRCTVLVYGKRRLATRAQGLTLRIFHKPSHPLQPTLF